MGTDFSVELIRIVEAGSQQIMKIGEEVMSHKVHEHVWSKKEILGHLMDSCINNYQRVLLAQTKDDLYFEGYHQEAWVKLNNYKDRELTNLVQQWVVLNQHFAELIKNVPQEKLLRQTTEHHFDRMSMRCLPKGSVSSLAYMIWDYIYHIEHHLKQIISDYVPSLPAYKALSV